MKNNPRNLEFWFAQLSESDVSKRLQALEKLIEMKHPKILDILIEIAETEKNEALRIKAIRALGRYKVSDPSEIFYTLKNLLIGENPKIRKEVVRAIVDLGDISAIRYLTKYYYSDYSIGIKPEVNKALDDLLAILDKKKRIKSKLRKKKHVQKKLIEKSPKSENNIDYKKYIKKFFD